MKRQTAPNLFKRLMHDNAGVAAIEFALIAPVMIAFYFGLCEFCQGYMAQKRLAHSASSVANLVAQTNAVTMNEVDDVMAIGELIMKPFPTTTLSTRVTSVTRDAKGVAKVDWSRVRGTGFTAYRSQATVTVPTDMIANGASLVMAETTYNYDSPVKYLMPSAVKLSNTFYELPRKVPQVLCSDCPP